MKRNQFILAVSGSLRRASLNTLAVNAAALQFADIETYPGIAELPLFNPDLEFALPHSVLAWRTRVRAASALIIASPEYAHGISGPMKNALDWLVAAEGVAGKPVALWSTSPRARHATPMLREVLITMSAYIVDDACLVFALPGSATSAQELLCSAPARHELRHAMEVLRTAFVRA
jgi:NAD(P)H-dependent FMN reductase